MYGLSPPEQSASSGKSGVLTLSTLTPDGNKVPSHLENAQEIGMKRISTHDYGAHAVSEQGRGLGN